MSDYHYDDEDDFEFDGEIVHQTDKAWLVKTDDDEEIWLPKSRCCNNHDGTFSVPYWLARAKGLA